MQENQNRHKEIDQYQQELAALQSSYSQKISNLNKKHKQEMQKWQEEKKEYIQRNEELEELLQAGNKQGTYIARSTGYKDTKSYGFAQSHNTHSVKLS